MMHVVDIEKLRDSVRSRGLSQTELVGLSKVSRATIAKLLSGKSTRVHARTVERLAGALGLTADELDKNNVETMYRRRLANEHQFLNFTGLGIVNTSGPMRLRDGYAQIMLRGAKECHADRRSERSAATVVQHENSGQEPPIIRTLEDAVVTETPFFVLGEPGSGKTTLLRYLAQSYADGMGLDDTSQDDRRIPIFVRLAEWAAQLKDDESVDLIHTALAQLQIEDSATTEHWLRVQAEAGNVLLLLDGLDEVGNPELQSCVIEGIRTFIRRYGNAHVILTSRKVGFENPNLGRKFQTYEVQPLEEDARRSFVQVWCASRHEHKTNRNCAECDRKIERLSRAIVEHPRIKVLAGNPMMLTILCLLHDAGAALPQRRYQLYEKIMEAFLFSWEQKKLEARSGAPDRKLTLDQREVLWLLESIALDMHTHDWTLVEGWWLLDKTSEFLQKELHYQPDHARGMAESLLWSLRQRSGVLVERGPERYGFVHLAFQEYFASRAILASNDAISALRSYFYHPRWREVVRLVAAGLDRRQAPQLLRQILDDPDPTGRFLHRGLLLALGCLADGAPLPDGELLSDIRDRTTGLGSNKWLGIPLHALALLGKLRSTRLGEFATDCTNRMLERATETLTDGEQSVLRQGACQYDLVENPDDETSKGAGLVDRLFGTDAPRDTRKDLQNHLVANAGKELRENPSSTERSFCAHALKTFAKPAPKVRRELLAALAQEEVASVRESIVFALQRHACAGTVKQKFLDILNNNEENADVREACASALRSVAVKDVEVRNTLMAHLNDEKLDSVRVGAAHGLEKCLHEFPDLRERVHEILQDATETEDVRVSCLRSLESLLPKVDGGVEFLTGLLSGGSRVKLTRVSAQVLAEYAATGQVAWKALPIEQIEQVIVSIDDPCPCAFGALRSLIEAREIRRLGITREERVKRALSPFSDRIETVFIYGSAARAEQGSDSDLDLMVIGDLSLRELAPGLKKAEAELGRQVNAVLYSRSEWEQRICEGNPFVKRVSCGEKIFVIGGQDDLAPVAR